MIETDRLLLRPFEPRDLAAFAAINADPRVMRYFPSPKTDAETAEMLDRCAERWRTVGLAFSAVTDRDGRLLGMCGLHRPEGLPISPCVEIGWRLTPSAWGKGIASEAARAWLAWGWGQGLSEILAYTPTLNAPSRAVMARIGMAEAPELAFDHPEIAEGHPLRPMFVARIRRPAWPPSSPCAR
ncbi:GNAT family N-acetyltransferase [Vannielia litorea]|uniref:Protein N-acetyltransferase, RimJ/RimL family n=1 Tax=Vannielia litorea TaxID=1217970 RepID=A0A1N6G7W4_9RHOB|nr:GNAT family N-acetyltransferase [Vannielia litorea]SIO03608.1 Protein N-acetyltransferase, RimJ/RimL family [Vannielia litorea]